MEAGSLSAELADYYSRPVDLKHNIGLPDRFSIQATTDINATPPHLSTEQLLLIGKKVVEMIQRGH